MDLTLYQLWQQSGSSCEFNGGSCLSQIRSPFDWVAVDDDSNNSEDTNHLIDDTNEHHQCGSSQQSQSLSQSMEIVRRVRELTNELIVASTTKLPQPKVELSLNEFSSTVFYHDCETDWEMLEHKPRTRKYSSKIKLTTVQYDRLEKLWIKYKYLSLDQMDSLAIELGVTRWQVIRWWQNKRRRAKVIRNKENKPLNKSNVSNVKKLAAQQDDNL